LVLVLRNVGYNVHLSKPMIYDLIICHGSCLTVPLSLNGLVGTAELDNSSHWRSRQRGV